MKQITGFLVCIFLSLNGAMAQEISPRQLELAKKYVFLTNSDDIFERSLISMSIQTYNSAVKLNPTLSKDLRDTLVKVIEGYRPRKDELIDQLARPYALRFTEQELQELVAFFETPVGRKLAAQENKLGSDVRAVVKVWNNKIRGEFRVKLRDGMKERGHDI